MSFHVPARSCQAQVCCGDYTSETSDSGKPRRTLETAGGQSKHPDFGWRSPQTPMGAYFKDSLPKWNPESRKYEKPKEHSKT